MGMYDEINFETTCPRCGEKVDEFQSKDGPCMLTTLEFWEVNEFYSSCRKCNTWIIYGLKKRPNRKIKIEDYKRSIRYDKDVDDLSLLIEKRIENETN